ncbi:condensation domain-containing protein [Gordonia jinhuaensis]|uniref:Condensation domain-containing protein n=1 Tax=Gordonia jinhuaensis TaxID=1517702 RepID=A0A916TDN7_9ACTN|nr:condensation domain-containing protein [Gordonia jinhuaensis]GGB40486.1 hypothetical protein GCM10011489_30080 [Gordonia jinhuaensis]
MEYTELADYPIPSGRITEWIPSIDAESYAVDPRPLSPNHRAHLDFFSRTDVHERLGAWIGTAFTLRGAFDHTLFAQTLEYWIARHDAFRTTVTEGRDHGFARLTAPADAVTIEVLASADTNGAGTYRYIEDVFARRISALTQPHMMAVTVESDDDGVIVVVGADHSVMDAYTQLLLIAELREIYSALSAGRIPALPPCGSYVEHCAAEHYAAAALVNEHPAIAEWESFWRTQSGALEMPAFPMPVRPAQATDTGPGHQASLSLWLLSAESTEAFAAACKRHGVSASTGAFSALAIAIHRLTAGADLRFVMPLHTRTTPESQAAAGWYVGLAPVEVNLDGVGTFVESLSRVDKSVRRNAGLAQHPYPTIAAAAGMADAPKFAISFVDTRYLPGAKEWGERDRALRCRVDNSDEVYLWVNRTLEGLNISLRFPNNEIAADSLHRLIAEFSDILRVVSRDGDVAVSLPPAHLSNDQTPSGSPQLENGVVENL